MNATTAIKKNNFNKVTDKTIYLFSVSLIMRIFKGNTPLLMWFLRSINSRLTSRYGQTRIAPSLKEAENRHHTVPEAVIAREDEQPQTP